MFIKVLWILTSSQTYVGEEKDIIEIKMCTLSEALLSPSHLAQSLQSLQKWM